MPKNRVPPNAPAPDMPVAPLQSPVLKYAPSVINVGLDIGYGAVKVVVHGLSPILFPSVWGLAIFSSKQDRAKIMAGNAENTTDLMNFDGQEWMVGNFAQRQLKAAQLSSLRGRSGSADVYGNESRLKLFKTAMGKIGAALKVQKGDVLHINLATGLPVSHMDGAESLEEILQQPHHVQNAAVDFTVNVSNLYIMPQPYGTIYANQFTENGTYNPCHTAKRTGVVDVGTYTVDLALDDDGEYITTESDSVEGGIYLVHQRLISLLKQRGLDMDNVKPGELDKILRTKCIQVGKATEAVDGEVDESLEVLRENTVNRMKQLWRTARTIDAIYLSGGGASLIKDEVLSAGFAQASLVDGSQFANAQGYYNFATFDTRPE